MPKIFCNFAHPPAVTYALSLLTPLCATEHWGATIDSLAIAIWEDASSRLLPRFRIPTTSSTVNDDSRTLIEACGQLKLE